MRYISSESPAATFFRLYSRCRWRSPTSIPAESFRSDARPAPSAGNSFAWSPTEGLRATTVLADRGKPTLHVRTCRSPKLRSRSKLKTGLFNDPVFLVLLCRACRFEPGARKSLEQAQTCCARIPPDRSFSGIRPPRPVAKSTIGSDSRSQGWRLGGSPFVAVVQAAYFWKFHHLSEFGTLHLPLDWSILIQPQVRPRSMVIAKVAVQYTPQVFAVQDDDDDMVQTLPTYLKLNVAS